MPKKHPGHNATPGDTPWTLDRWKEPAYVPPTRGRTGRGCPLASFLSAAGGNDPLFQDWTRFCLEKLALVRCTEDPGRDAILQTAACLQAVHHGARLYRARFRPTPASGSLSESGFRLFLARPVFLRFPSRVGTQAIAVHGFEKGDHYQVAFDGQTRFQIITDRSVVLVGFLRAEHRPVVIDMAPEELRQALSDVAPAVPELAERPDSVMALRSLAATFSPSANPV